MRSERTRAASARAAAGRLPSAHAPRGRLPWRPDLGRRRARPGRRGFECGARGERAAPAGRRLPWGFVGGRSGVGVGGGRAVGEGGGTQSAGLRCGLRGQPPMGGGGHARDQTLPGAAAAAEARGRQGGGPSAECGRRGAPRSHVHETRALPASGSWPQPPRCWRACQGGGVSSGLGVGAADVSKCSGEARLPMVWNAVRAAGDACGVSRRHVRGRGGRARAGSFCGCGARGRAAGRGVLGSPRAAPRRRASQGAPGGHGRRGHRAARGPQC
ncbi:MAG: hypothetical protein J3K34DRAFT_440437 [Monoraphidium minutum]|nr:MAG: hypothetical protein J3K34DRAFT_440437 [Monoraphidium minutum]